VIGILLGWWRRNNEARNGRKPSTRAYTNRIVAFLRIDTKAGVNARQKPGDSTLMSGDVVAVRTIALEIGAFTSVTVDGLRYWRFYATPRLCTCGGVTENSPSFL
jgi:hypothetical protein